LVRAILEDPAFSGAVGAVEITEAQSGFDAMRLLPRTRYDLIITDINMPDVNGLELIHFIRKSEQYRRTPLVIISTQATERDVERGKKLGADAYVPKPFSPDVLRATCEKLLATSPEGAGPNG
jgi:two-component system chemotaxis response regulator CheY